MEGETKRFTLTVPNDLATRAEALKQSFFQGKPYAEMYRQLITLGMEKLNKEGIHQDCSA